jgi:hypothetical protein
VGGNLKEIDHLVNIGVDIKMILKWIFRMGRREMYSGSE